MEAGEARVYKPGANGEDKQDEREKTDQDDHCFVVMVYFYHTARAPYELKGHCNHAYPPPQAGDVRGAYPKRVQ